MSTMTDMDTLPMSTLNKLKKKKFEQARNAHRFFLEQLLIFMIYFRAKNEQHGHMETNEKFISNLFLFVNHLNRKDDDYIDLLKTIFGMINGNKNQFEIITFLQEQIIKDQERASEQQIYLNNLADCPFISNRLINSKYCAFMLFHLNRDKQHWAVAELIEVGEKNLTDEKLNEIFYSHVSCYPEEKQERFDEEKFDDKIIEMMTLSSFRLMKNTPEEKFINEIYKRNFRANISAISAHRTSSIPERLIEQAEIFGYKESIGELAHNIMCHNFDPYKYSVDDDGLLEKSRLKVISDIYISCRSSLFQKTNQVPKIIASIIEFDLRDMPIDILFQRYGHMDNVKDSVTQKPNENVHPLLYKREIRMSGIEMRNEIKEAIKDLVIGKSGIDNIKIENITDLITENAKFKKGINKETSKKIDCILKKKGYYLSNINNLSFEISEIIANEIEREETKTYLENLTGLTDDEKEDLIIAQKQNELNKFYKELTTAIISNTYSNSEFMNSWKDKKSMSYRFRLGDKILQEYFENEEKCIFNIMKEQAEKITKSNIRLPEAMMSNAVILPMMII